MSKIYCHYETQGGTEANHECDICKIPLCSICGYNKNDVDYCNDCWTSKETDKIN